MTTMDNLLRLVWIFLAVLLALGLVAIERYWGARGQWISRSLRRLIALWAVLNGAFIVLLWFNHIRFPLHLDLMEGVILQHLRQVMALKPIYPEPSPAYVALAYNPLYYVMSAPFAHFLGTNLLTLRLVAILGMLGSALTIFVIVREQTRSRWWGLVAAGLFAAAYSAMDAYLDTAHSDSWLIFSALLGSYLLGRSRAPAWSGVGVLVLVASFWFKQHGVIFVLGGLVFLTLREGIRSSIRYWLLALMAGPMLYMAGGSAMFGPRFHYFTWEVPRQWSEFSLQTLRRLGAFVVLNYFILASAAAWYVFRTFVRTARSLNIWQIQWIGAVLSGLMGTLDIGSSNNVYIPMGTWIIVVGTLGLFEFGRLARAQKYGLHVAALVGVFVALLYNPAAVLVPASAQASYRDMIAFLYTLDGPVYAPTLGQLQGDYAFYPAAHWVALEDMIRGPGKDTRNHPNTRSLLDPALHPEGKAYILANLPLNAYGWLAFLEDYYVLDQDLGERFAPLQGLPRRFDHGYPRYLYRYMGNNDPSLSLP